MSPSKTLPEFLVWSLISFYWLKNLRTWVDNKPLSLRISLIVSIKKTTSLLFFFLNWRNFKCGTRLTKDLHLSFFFLVGGGIKKKFKVISLTPCWPTGHLKQLDTFQVLSYMTVVLSWSCLSLSLLKPETHQQHLRHQDWERQTYKVTTFGSSAVKRLTFFV